MVQFLLFCPFRKLEYLIFSIACNTVSNPYSLILAFNNLYLFVLGFIATNFCNPNEFQESIIGCTLVLLTISLDIVLLSLPNLSLPHLTWVSHWCSCCTPPGIPLGIPTVVTSFDKV